MLTATLKAFAADESGATAIEYGLLAALIAVAIIGTFVAVGNGVQSLFNNAGANTLASQAAKIK